jgi:hypothetical protein
MAEKQQRIDKQLFAAGVKTGEKLAATPAAQ